MYVLCLNRLTLLIFFRLILYYVRIYGLLLGQESPHPSHHTPYPPHPSHPHPSHPSHPHIPYPPHSSYPHTPHILHHTPYPPHPQSFLLIPPSCLLLIL